MTNTTAINLRAYQIAAIESIRNAFKQDRKQLFCLPTGGGKTIIFNHIAQSTVAKNKTVLIVTDRLELLSQTAKKSSIPCSVIDSKTKAVDTIFSKLYIGMVRSVLNRIDMLPNIDLVIIDEAHRGEFATLVTKLEARNPNIFVLGVTATPVSSAKKILANIYTQLTESVTVTDLISTGYLAKPRYFSIDKVDISEVKIKPSTGDYDEAQMFDAYNKKTIYDGLLENYNAIAVGMKTIVFCINIQHTILTYEAFESQGLPTFLVHSEMKDDERQRNLQGFRESADGIMVNCGILTTGYDEPAIEAVILNRSTTSLALYMQMCGRGSRTLEGKTNFIVLDMGFNIDKLGVWDQEVNWGAHFRGELLQGVKRKHAMDKKIAAEKVEFNLKERLLQFSLAKERIDLNGEREELANILNISSLSIPLQEILIRQRAGNSKTKKAYTLHWVVYQICTKTEYKKLVIEYANFKGYSSAWVRHAILSRSK